jgi:hypothetical protein
MNIAELFKSGQIARMLINQGCPLDKLDFMQSACIAKLGEKFGWDQDVDGNLVYTYIRNMNRSKDKAMAEASLLFKDNEMIDPDTHMENDLVSPVSAPVKIIDVKPFDVVFASGAKAAFNMPAPFRYKMYIQGDPNERQMVDFANEDIEVLLRWHTWDIIEKKTPFDENGVIVNLRRPLVATDKPIYPSPYAWWKAVWQNSWMSYPRLLELSEILLNLEFSIFNALLKRWELDNPEAAFNLYSAPTKRETYPGFDPQLENKLWTIDRNGKWHQHKNKSTIGPYNSRPNFKKYKK